jgi:hypothetical protein
MEESMNENQDVLAHLRSFGFTMQENNAQGFIRWQKRIGDMLVTIANGQFENKIRVSLLQDRNGNIRTSYKDILAYTELICSLQDAGLTGMSQDCTCYQEEDVVEPMDNPLISFPRKPEGFMAQ